MDRKKQEKNSIVIRRDILHNYLLKNVKLHSNTRKLNVKTNNIYFICGHKHIQPCTKCLQCEVKI